MSSLQFKIGWFMAATIPVAILLGVVTSPLDPVPLFLFLLAVWTFLAFGLYVALVVAPYSVIVSRRACPSCRARTMVCLRVGLWPPLSGAYRCRSCDAILEHRRFRGWTEPSMIEAKSPDSSGKGSR